MMAEHMTHKVMRMILNGKSSDNPAVREAVGQVRELGKFVLKKRYGFEEPERRRWRHVYTSYQDEKMS